MKSTGEVMGIGINFGEAYAKAQKGANKSMPRSGTVFVSVKDSDKKYLDELVPLIVNTLSPRSRWARIYLPRLYWASPAAPLCLCSA